MLRFCPAVIGNVQMPGLESSGSWASRPPAAIGPYAVMTTSTSDTSPAGTSPIPVTGNVAVAPAARGAVETPPVPSRVSRAVTGLTGKNCPGAGSSVPSAVVTCARAAVRDTPAHVRAEARSAAMTTKRVKIRAGLYDKQHHLWNAGYSADRGSIRKRGSWSRCFLITPSSESFCVSTATFRGLRPPDERSVKSRQALMRRK
jgi:hypothetical protein